MTTHTLTTTNGHQIDVTCWASNTLNFSIAIDGQHYTDGSSMIGAGDTEETEAAHQAQQTAEEIASGCIRRIDGKWQHYTEPSPFRFVATYQGETLGYYDTQEEAEAAIDAARAENEES